MIDQGDAAATIELILDRNLRAYSRTLDIQQAGDTYQINEILADGSLKPLADTLWQPPPDGDPAGIHDRNPPWRLRGAGCQRPS